MSLDDIYYLFHRHNSKESKHKIIIDLILMAELQYRRPSSEYPTTTFLILLLCNTEREEGLAVRKNRSWTEK